MPGFDFSKANLRRWGCSLPQYNLFLDHAGWKEGRFVGFFSSIVGHTSFERVFQLFKLSCEPEFALLVQDENRSLSIWERCSELELTGDDSHLIVVDSEWAKSFSDVEPYGDSCRSGELVHYIVCSGNDYVHLLSKAEPSIEALGLCTDKMFLSRQQPLVALERDVREHLLKEPYLEESIIFDNPKMKRPRQHV